MFGASMAAPFAIPPTVKPAPRTSASLRCVSVVRIASAASASPSGRRAAASAGTPRSMTSIGRGMPMSPVEQTSTSVASPPIWAATAAHMRSAFAWPSAPVAAFAFPLLRMTAAARPPVASRCARVTRTGAAVILFAVNTAAAGTGCPSAVATSERSGTPAGLMPQ
jgi:hypothetical protein